MIDNSAQKELPEDESLADGESSNQTESQSKWSKAKDEFNNALVHSWHMMKRGDIIMQSVMWAYNGLEITFWSGVFPTCIGQTKQLANRFGVVGLSGIIVGVGELSGAALSTLTGNTTLPPRGPLGTPKLHISSGISVVVKWPLYFIHVVVQLIQKKSAWDSFAMRLRFFSASWSCPTIHPPINLAQMRWAGWCRTRPMCFQSHSCSVSAMASFKIKSVR